MSALSLFWAMFTLHGTEWLQTKTYGNLRVPRVKSGNKELKTKGRFQLQTCFSGTEFALCFPYKLLTPSTRNVVIPAFCCSKWCLLPRERGALHPAVVTDLMDNLASSPGSQESCHKIVCQLLPWRERSDGGAPLEGKAWGSPCCTCSWTDSLYRGQILTTWT